MTQKQTSLLNKLKREGENFITPGIISLLIIILILATAFVLYPKGGEQEEIVPNNEEQLQKDTKLESRENSRVNTHVVVTGDSLSSIAQTFYGDKDKWPILAAENNIGNPDIIHVGTPIRIPNLEEQTSSTSTEIQENSEQEISKTQDGENLITRTVITGDTLWEFSKEYYGTGYLWFKIRDANPNKVGLLPNGRPLITPGTILVIPSN